MKCGQIRRERKTAAPAPAQLGHAVAILPSPAASQTSATSWQSPTLMNPTRWLARSYCMGAGVRGFTVLTQS